MNIFVLLKVEKLRRRRKLQKLKMWMLDQQLLAIFERLISPFLETLKQISAILINFRFLIRRFFVF